mgnify:CR=1 FL=1
MGLERQGDLVFLQRRCGPAVLEQQVAKLSVQVGVQLVG